MSDEIYKITPEQTPFMDAIEARDARIVAENKWWEDELKPLHPDDQARVNAEMWLLAAATHDGKIKEACDALNALEKLWPYREAKE